MRFSLMLSAVCLISVTADDAPACDDDACQWETSVQTSSLLQARGSTTKVNVGTLEDLYSTGDEGSQIKSKKDTQCIDYDVRQEKNGNVYVGDCHEASNQRWEIDEKERIVSKKDGKCMDYHERENNVYMSDCHDGNNQKWKVDEEDRIVSKQDSRCMDYHQDEGKNLYVSDCHAGENQKWYLDELTAGKNPKYAQSLTSQFDHKCMDAHTENHNVFGHACHEGKNQQWYFTSNKQVKNNHDGDKCLDYCLDASCNKNVYMSDCHDGTNQKWNWDEKNRLVSEYVDVIDQKKCLDYNMSGNGNYYVHDCHDGTNQQFYLLDTIAAVKYGRMYPTFTLPVKCDMRCLHFATEKSDTSLRHEQDQTMCPKPWMVLGIPCEDESNDKCEARWKAWDDPESACDIDEYGECPSDEAVDEAVRATNYSHVLFDDPDSNDDCSTDCADLGCPTYDELVRLPNPWTEDDPCCKSGCDKHQRNAYVPNCVKRKTVPCKVKKLRTPKNVLSLGKGRGLHRMVELMKAAMIDAPPTSAFLAGWLGKLKPILGNATLLDLTWPGSHDTGTYDLSDIVSKNPFTASDVGGSSIGAFYAGKATTLMPEFIRLMGQAQGLDIIDQLNGGIRYIDFRIDFTHTNEDFGIGHSSFREDDWFVMHGTQTKHPAVFHLAQVKAFLDRNPDEIVVILCTRRGSIVSGEHAWPGAERKDKAKFWNETLELFGELMFDHSKGSLDDTPLRVMLERNQRLVWYSMDWVDFTDSSNYSIDAGRKDIVDMVTAWEKPGCGDEDCEPGISPRVTGQKGIFGDDHPYPGKPPNTIRVFSMAAVMDGALMEVLALRNVAEARQWSGANITLMCGGRWGIKMLSDSKWCPLTLMDAALLVNYYNQEALEWAYNDITKNFPTVIHIDMIDHGGMMRVGTEKIVPLGEAGDYDHTFFLSDEGKQNRKAGYPFSATLVGKNIQRLCKDGRNKNECDELKLEIEQVRGDSPVKTWDDKGRGRYKQFSDIYS